VGANEVGALLEFAPASSGTTAILARVGVSLISVDQACANAEEEIPNFDFDTTENQARAQWNDILGRVQVDITGVPNETVQLLYSSVSANFV
jgi:putative alpha-1,2-mannosidase